MRIDYQRITEELYERPKERDSRPGKAAIIGLLLLLAIPALLLLVFGSAAFALWHELRGF